MADTAQGARPQFERPQIERPLAPHLQIWRFTITMAASITGVPEGTVRTRLHHAKKKLREALSQEGLE